MLILHTQCVLHISNNLNNFIYNFFGNFDFDLPLLKNNRYSADVDVNYSIDNDNLEYLQLFIYHLFEYITYIINH